MLLSELRVLVNNDAEWSFLGRGSYNTAFLSKRSHTINGYTGFWVLKQAKGRGLYLSSIDRSVRLWNLLNPKYPSLAVENGWLAPYLGNQVALDGEVAEKLIEIYRQHRVILLDAYVSSNFLKYKGDVVVIDIDYAVRRGSKSMGICIDNQANYSVLLDTLEKGRASKPKSTSVVHTLLYLDKHALGSVVKKEHITPEMIGLLRIFRIFKKPILPNTLNYLLTYTQIKPLTNIIPEELFRFVDEEQYRGSQKIKIILLDAICFNKIDELTGMLTALGSVQPRIRKILEDKDDHGRTPIVLAAMKMHWDVVIKIASHFHTDDEDKMHYTTALWYAVSFNHTLAVRALIDAKTLECDRCHLVVGSDNGNTLFHYAIRISHESILNVLTRESWSNKSIFNAAFTVKNNDGFTPFRLALRTNPIAVTSLMKHMKLFYSRTKLQIFQNAGDDLIRAAQSNRFVFSDLLRQTATMNSLDHEQLYNDTWLEKERGFYPSIYENRIQCLIHELLKEPSLLIDVNKRHLVEVMRRMFDRYMASTKSVKELAVVLKEFSPFLDKLKKQSRQPSGWYLFFCCTQWTEENKKEAEKIFKLAETIEKLTSPESLLESAPLGPVQSEALEIAFQ